MLSMTRFLLAIIILSTAHGEPDVDPFYYSGAPGTQMGDHVKETNSFIPHLPVYYGYMATHGTFRFFTVIEQVLTMIGEGKHGLWRIQDNGHIREYLAAGETGIPANSDVMDPSLFETINSSYAAFLPDESFGGYKYPDQEFTEEGNMAWVDLPISHPKYADKYADHPPIDLPHWYCTMSQAAFPYASDAWAFISKQPSANEIGPLGQRAGLDITELYPNVIRMYPFPDARSWVNVGIGADTDIFTQDSIKYLFVTAVFDNADNDDLSYIRPDGLYYEHLLERGFDDLKTTITENPRFHLESYERDGESLLPAIGTPLYGVNHPNRREDGMSGGACPLRGGDWAYYPFGNSGAGWPTNYEEISPLCDAVIMDVKLWANLGVESWNDPDLFLGNAGVGTPNVTYFMDANMYGFYSDPYLANLTNPYAIDMTSQGQLVPPGGEVESVDVSLEYPAVRGTVPYVATEPCVDSTMWYKWGEPSKNCEWVALWPPRCDAFGIDNDSTGTAGLVKPRGAESTVAMDACPNACGMCN